MLTVHLGDPNPSHSCPDCGAEVEVVSGSVHLDGIPLAVYDASYCRAHHDRGASLRIIIGDWSEGTPLEARASFGLEVRALGSEYEFMLAGADRSAWGSTSFAGPMLTRDQALAHPAKGDVFHIAELIIHEDTRLFEFLIRGHNAA